MIDHTAKYSIELWDHDAQDWSRDLASLHLDGPAEHLTGREVMAAVRRLKAAWERDSMYVARENGRKSSR